MHHLSRAQQWLGTMVEITASHLDGVSLEAVIDAAFVEIARLHNLMTVHLADSELSNLNAKAYFVRIPVSIELRTVLETALALAADSGGSFDPTVGELLKDYGFLPQLAQKQVLKDKSSTAERINVRSANWQDVDLNQDGLYFKRPLSLDLGGIAKGYVVDCALAVLKQAGCSSGLVNAGGDLALFGDTEQIIHVQDPRGGYLPLIKLSQGAFATSCYKNNRRKHLKKWQSPLIDPNTQTSRLSTDSVSVLAPSCMIADALTKLVSLKSVHVPAVLSKYNATASVLSYSNRKLTHHHLPEMARNFQD